MKIGIYSEPYGGGLGNSEYIGSILAELLGKSHQVELVHHRASLTIEQLKDFSGRHLSGVALRYVAPEVYTLGGSRNPLRHYQHARAWHSDLSEPYDLFIGTVRKMPPFCHAAKGVLIVLFPFYSPPYSAPPEGGDMPKHSLASLPSRSYHKWEWQKRMESYQVKTAISEAARAQARRLWGIDCQVVNPPAELSPCTDGKTNSILSVGGFSTEEEMHGKKQSELLNAFRGLKESDLGTWEYFSVGSTNNSSESKTYFDGIRRLGAECQAQVMANVKRTQLRELFQRARIFWHAAGDAEIVTVDAMAAGCVPVVIDRRGGSEIVEHGISGYLWENDVHLKEYTLELAHDESLRKRMSEAARDRARLFSLENFQKKFMGLLEPLLS